MTLPSTAQPAPRRWRLVLAFAGAQAIVLALLLGPLWGEQWWAGFRRYFAYDQLSYAAIASNVAHGDLRLVEPFTQTGSLYYPSLWYYLIGLAARITGLPVYLLWTLLALAVISVAVGVVGWVAHRVSQRSWAPLLPAVALLTGTLSVATSGSWGRSLSSHAVLWGPYGTLYTLNAETIGLSLIAIAMCLLVLAARTAASDRRPRWALVLGAAAIVGLLASVQTYSFFSALILVGLFVAALCLIRERSRARSLVTLGLVGVVMLAGSTIAMMTGPLAVFGLLLLSLLPAAWPLVHNHLRLAVAAGAVTALVAAPQVVRTLIGLAQGDPFLTYRQDSTQDLGVSISLGVLAAMPLLLVAFVCVVGLWHRGPAELSALLIALAAGAVLMSSNDRWGFAQEPYRFWLQFAILSTLLITPVLAWAITQAPLLAGSRRALFIGAAVIASVVWLVGLADVTSFWSFARQQGVLPAEDARASAIRALLGEHDDLILSSACLAPQELKLISPGPVAFYNRGLAWPENEPAFAVLQDDDARAGEDETALQAADVRLVLTDSACVNEWQLDAAGLPPARTKTYQQDGETQTLTLWTVAPA